MDSHISHVDHQDIHHCPDPAALPPLSLVLYYVFSATASGDQCCLPTAHRRGLAYCTDGRGSSRLPGILQSQGEPSSLWKSWHAGSPDPHKQPLMACVYIGVCTCLLKQQPSQIQPLYPIPCNPVGNVAAVNQLPFDQACSWLEFAQMCHTCGKTQAFSLTVQMFPDIVMFVDRKHLDV